jgi:hypothetical protein
MSLVVIWSYNHKFCMTSLSLADIFCQETELRLWIDFCPLLSLKNGHFREIVTGKNAPGAAQSLFLVVGLLAGLGTLDSAFLRLFSKQKPLGKTFFLNFDSFQLLSTL